MNWGSLPRLCVCELRDCGPSAPALRQHSACGCLVGGPDFSGPGTGAHMETTACCPPPAPLCPMGALYVCVDHMGCLSTLHPHPADSCSLPHLSLGCTELQEGPRPTLGGECGDRSVQALDVGRTFWSARRPARGGGRVWKQVACRLFPWLPGPRGEM